MKSQEMHPQIRQTELVIFDLDGTLIDSKKDLGVAINWALENTNIGTKTEAELDQLLAMGSMNGVKSLFSKNPSVYEKVYRLFSEYYEENILVHTQLYEGIVELLEKLKPSFRIALMSNKREHFCHKILQGLEIHDYFHPILGGDSVETKKPDPLPLQRICKSLEIEASKTIMVGDSPADVNAGKAAGIFTVGLTGGFTSPEILRKSGPDLTLNLAKDILQMF